MGRIYCAEDSVDAWRRRERRAMATNVPTRERSARLYGRFIIEQCVQLGLYAFTSYTSEKKTIFVV